MNDNQLKRYSRHILLPEIDITGQETLLNATALIIGLGGLGSTTALYLASSGVGRLILADFDVVELSNLQRQVIHFNSDIGRLKVDSAADKILALNPEIEIIKLSDVNEACLKEMFEISDIVLDGTDNFKSRFIINQLSIKTKTPLVSASVIRFEGQVSVFKGWLSDKPCYNCLYAMQGDEDENCTNNGVLAPMVAIVGGIQALETLKVLLNFPDTLTGKLLLIDGLTHQSNLVKLNKDLKCVTCC
jgi:adenylyltransferase/sulfurtransferase